MNKNRSPYSYLALGAGLALLLFTRFVFVLFEHINFDSDQAIIGLMAKHISELKELPVFYYGQQYMLGIEAWLAAPLFALFGPTPQMLKFTVFLLNAAAFILIYRILVVECVLSPFRAVASLLFFLAPSVVASAKLLETNGGNIEPFVWIALIWMARKNPVALGLVSATGFLNREFSIFGLAGVLVFHLISKRYSWKDFVMLAASFMGVYFIAHLLAIISGDTRGISSVTHIGIKSPSAAILYSKTLFAEWLPTLFGAGSFSMNAYKMTSSLTFDNAFVIALAASGILVLCAVFLSAFFKEIKNKNISTRREFPLFLIFVGSCACAAFILFGNELGSRQIRYVLLALLLPAGMAAFCMAAEISDVAKKIVVAAALTVAVANSASSAMLWNEFLTNPPRNTVREATDYLVSHNIKYVYADYWRCYVISFLSGERVIATNIHNVRIMEYHKLVDENPDKTYRLQNTKCKNETIVAGWHVCPDFRP